jgi:PAS domain S-box-containing protein
VNPTWLSTLGYNREEVLGKFYADFLHPDWKPHFEENFPAFKKRGYVNDVQFKIRHKDGHYLYISFEGCIGYYPDGSFKQTYCVFKDITKQKQAEEELAKYREQLEEMVNERTKELKDKNKELDNALKVFVGREMTIKKLQDRIKALGGK